MTIPSTKPAADGPEPLPAPVVPATVFHLDAPSVKRTVRRAGWVSTTSVDPAGIVSPPSAVNLISSPVETFSILSGCTVPALGPVIERRSQRQIDFWPTRPALLAKALERAPQTLADMEPVGTPAKGFPAMEQLLAAQPSPAHCPYLVLVAEGIEAEAVALRAGFDALAARDWTSDEDAARTAFAEWINQWLGGLERLRWMHVEQPVQKARTAGQGHAPEFARLTAADNAAEWRAQWQALRTQARLTAAQRAQPPQPGQGLVPIEALLMGKGQIALAQRWGQALDRADAAIAALPAKAGEKELMALSKTLKGVTTLFQTEVAAALDVPLGFSDADGD